MIEDVARALLCFALASCGAPSPAIKPVSLATPTSHVATNAERHDAACKREHLMPVEQAAVVAGTIPSEDEIVRSVSARDQAGKPVQTSAEIFLPLPIGKPFTAEGGREVMRRLWKTGRFDDIIIDASHVDGGAAIVFDVVGKRTIGEVFTAGEVDTAALHLVTGAVYDPVALVNNTRSLTASWMDRGHLDAEFWLTSAFADEAHRVVDVCVRIEPGHKITLSGITISGSAHDAALANVLAEADTHNVKGATLDPSVLERDLLVLAAWLYDQGLLTHKIDKSIERHGDTIGVALKVTDGPAFRYSKIEVRGDLVAPKAEYVKLITQHVGDVFSRSLMVAAIETMRTLQKTAGREDVEIEPSTELDAANNTVAVVIVVRDPKKPKKP